MYHRVPNDIFETNFFSISYGYISYNAIIRHYQDNLIISS